MYCCQSLGTELEGAVGAVEEVVCPPLVQEAARKNATNAGISSSPHQLHHASRRAIRDALA